LFQLGHDCPDLAENCTSQLRWVELGWVESRRVAWHALGLWRKWLVEEISFQPRVEL